MRKLNWKLLTNKRNNSTQGIPPQPQRLQKEMEEQDRRSS